MEIIGDLSNIAGYRILYMSALGEVHLLRHEDELWYVRLMMLLSYMYGGEEHSYR